MTDDEQELNPGLDEQGEGDEPQEPCEGDEPQEPGEDDAAEEVSERLDNLAMGLINMMLTSISLNWEVAPTLAYVEEGSIEPVCLSFEEDGFDVSLEAARAKVGTLPENVDAYAIAYDGFIQDDDTGETFDALLIEFGQRGMKSAYSAYVEYEKGASPEEFMVATPLPAGLEPLLLT